MPDTDELCGIPRPLGPHALQVVCAGAQRILDTMGVRMDSPEALDLLEDLSLIHI